MVHGTIVLIIIYMDLTAPQNEARGTTNAPVKLMLPSAISSTSQPTWYITVEYAVVNLTVWRGNVDQTLT